MQIRVIKPTALPKQPTRAPQARGPQGGAQAPAPTAPSAMAPDRWRARSIVAQLPAPPESAWYRLKKWALDVLCNIEFASPKIQRLTETAAVRVQPLLRPGDILLRRTEGTSGNFFIPSWWKHAAVYTGKGDLVEATFSGVQKTSLEEFFTHGDHVVILRAKDLKKADRKAMVAWSEAQLGKPYDFDADFEDSSRLMCTELARTALKVGAKQDLVPLNWMGTVTGDNFLNEHFETVWSSEG